MALIRLLLVAALVNYCVADFYLQHPRGSNNKLNEQSTNTNNANRLFDSQNNNQAGYQVGDNCTPNCQTGGNYDSNIVGAGQGKMKYHVGSILYIEWTVQHGCASENTAECEIIFQYMCDNNGGAAIRDGKTTNTITNAAPPTGDDQAAQFGRHESQQFYYDCSVRARNAGLFTADQNMGQFATSTRQNNNGQNNRFGYECPEERDYYPYWHPSPWKDIVVFTQKPARCDYYQKESQNVKDKNYCSKPAFNGEQTCAAGGGQWLSTPAWGITRPDCQPAPWARDNHHGNGMNGQMHSYNWTIPDDVNSNCVLRGRYNISTSEYDGWGDVYGGGGFVDAGNNGNLSPVQTNPTKNYVNVPGVDHRLRLNVNTDQYGRTFEDRSHVFEILTKADTDIPLRRVYNLNVRGKRGNNQQTYPALEYDFAPTVLHVRKGDYIHFQWHGSDANAGNQAGTGIDKTDRSNIVQIATRMSNTPMAADKNTMFLDKTGDPDMAQVDYFAYINQQNCDTTTNNQNDPKNCFVLNAAPAYFDGGLVQMRKMGTHHYMSTRNNNWSNRTQKGTIVVHPDPLDFIIAFSVVGFVVIAGAIAGIMIYRRMRRHPKYSQCRPDPFPCCCCCRISAEDKPPGRFRRWWINNGAAATLLFVYVVCNCIIFLYGVLSYVHEPIPVPIARGGGALLNFNCALILMPVLRNIISFLRLTPLAEKIPLDNNIVFHKIVAFVIFCGTVIHVVCHYVDYTQFRQWYGWPVASQALWTRAGLTGHLILTMMTILFVTAIPERLRRQGLSCCGRTCGNYDTFWAAHQLYIPILVGLWIHAPRFWIWSLWPILLFILEKLIKYYRSHDTTELQNAEMVGKDVLKVSLRIRGFQHKAGQYLYLACPRLSKYEWHPFTISSAPESELVTVHIRVCGDWTRALKKLLIEGKYVSKSLTSSSGSSSASEQEEFLEGPQTNSYSILPQSGTTVDEQQETSSSDDEEAGKGKKDAGKKGKKGGGAKDAKGGGGRPGRKEPPTMKDMHPGEPIDPDTILLCDGPYGSASEYVFNYKTVVLVGTGIGITPFAAIMRSMRVRLGRAQCNDCQSNGLQDVAAESLKPHKVYLYWVCRDADQFNWFITLINDIKDDPTIRRLFEFNTYMTAELDLNLVRQGKAASGSDSDVDAKKRNDLLAVNSAGKPTWSRIFGELKGKHPGEEIGIFLCGPPAVGKEISTAIEPLSGLRKGETRFIFHKENF